MQARQLQQPILRDEDIVQMIRENEPCVYDILYKRYWSSLLNFATVYNKDRFACQEIVQELFVQLLTNGSRLKINSSLLSYLLVSIRNKMFNYMRKQTTYKKHVLIAGNTANPSNNNVEQAIDFMELQKEIIAVLHQMPQKYKEVYLLHQEHHYTIKKIAEILHRPVNTVEKQLRKAKYLIRTHLIMQKVLQN